MDHPSFTLQMYADDLTPSADDGNDTVSINGDYREATVFLGGGNDIFNGGDNTDIVYGGDGHDVLHGNGGDDIIIGGDGADEMSGGTGNNSDIWQSGDYTGAYDTISEYSATRDMLDVTQLLTGYDDNSDIHDFMRIESINANSSWLLVDFDGSAGGQQWTQVAMLQHALSGFIFGPPININHVAVTVAENTIV
jgi:Ca2+-binding RTX toxin-like protein